MNALKKVKHLRKTIESFERNFNRCAVLTTVNKEDFVIKSFLPNVNVRDVSFLKRLWKDSEHFKNHVAIQCAETKKFYTYEQLWAHMARYATSLRKRLSFETGDVVAVMLPNCPEYPVVIFGTIQAGGVLTTINPIYKEFEICHQLNLTQPKIIITLTECYKTITAAMTQVNSKAKIIIVDKQNEAIPENTIRFTEIAESGEIDLKVLNKVETDKKEIAFLPFSSGTTGLPKAVEITQYNVMAGLDMMQNERVSLPQLTSGDYQDVVPCVLPFFHIYGLMVTLVGHLARGCKLVSIPKFSTSLYLDVLKNDKATILYVVPPIALLLSKHPDVKEEHLQSVKHLLCGAAPFSASDAEPLIEKTKGKLNLCQGYGATETTSMATSTLIGVNPDYSSSGFPLGSIDMKFIDPLTGTSLPVGVEGELLIRGPNIMRGYYKNEKATKESMTDDGFFRTGDLGYYKPDVGLFITDRIKELIKVKGMQVAPAELESVLRSHPAVQDAAVIGIPHEISGEVPKAFIITKDGKKTNEEELQDFVAKQVAVFKKIEEVQFVEEIPKTASGKILRRELKKMYV